METLSIIIPVFNEKLTIREIIRRIESVPFSDVKVEIVIVDDGSVDGTREILQTEFSQKHKILLHEKNFGKGSAIRTGLGAASGSFFIIQDADLEYDPNDILVLLQTLRQEALDVIYGSRVLRSGTKQYSSPIFHIGGLLVTWWANLLFDIHITDEATCYKMFTKKVLDKIHLKCKGFEFCPEFTGKIINAGFTIKEVPIDYHPRGKNQGKKIKIHDGFIALLTLLRIKLFHEI